MSHSLHRLGSEKSLDQEIVFILTPSKGRNSKGAKEQIRRFLDIIVSNKPVHYGDDRVGNRYDPGYDEIVNKLEEITNIHAVFNDFNTAKKVFKEIVEADLGLSVVVSGLFVRAKECCESAGVKYHSIEHSLGIFGNLKLLPEPKTLEILTMCGHGLISANRIKLMAQDIRDKKKSSREAAESLARQCLCGIFNTERGAQILEEIASSP